MWEGGKGGDGGGRRGVEDVWVWVGQAGGSGEWVGLGGRGGVCLCRCAVVGGAD